MNLFVRDEETLMMRRASRPSDLWEEKFEASSINGSIAPCSKSYQHPYQLQLTIEKLL